MTLPRGMDVVSRAGRTRYTVVSLLGQGSQGSVHRVRPAGGGQDLALKWYTATRSNEVQLERIREVLRFERPSPNFLWPIDLADGAEVRGFGYLMPLRGTGMRSLAEVLNGVAPMRLRAQCEAGARIADAFLRLHARGLCYADISVSNAFVDPATGLVEICDNDNVAIDGADSAVLGTPYFMAPEILRGDASPSSVTDRHSLAVILHMLLVRTHPLLGARESATRILDMASLHRLLGEEPVFLFDPDDESNRPSDEHDNARVLWPALPAFARRLFTAAFTEGLREPVHGRVTEGVWRSAFLRLRALVRTCPVCGAEQFFDEDEPTRPCAALDCRATLDAPRRLIGRRAVVLEQDAAVHRSDLHPIDLDADEVVGTVISRPPTGALALWNRSDVVWTVDRAAGRTQVPPGSAVVARPGDRVRTGGAGSARFVE
ncbi:MAG: eukaryotic-like serine/threonine-protein kinase [Microbacteriaceae bacterium]|nr:eukaryotic-like serine/threonine-protein kinase [Microbacteriaceae bacterium]